MASALSTACLQHPDRTRQGPHSYDVRELGAELPPVTPRRLPYSAPNVLMVVLDEVGFAASSAFGGPVHTPTAERLAGAGLRYTRFHTTALGQATRTALLTGRNHHAVGMGHMTAGPVTGAAPQWPNTAAPLAEILRQYGYSSTCFDTRHEASVLADKTIEYIRHRQSTVPDGPFLSCFAPGDPHTPRHVPVEWIAKYRGRFDEGWDSARGATFARQRELGVIGRDAVLTPRPGAIPAWEDVPEERKPALCRRMEVYAAYLEYADHHTGRVIDALQESGILADTLVVYLIGGNGASADAGLNGSFTSATASDGGGCETPEPWTERLDEMGGPHADGHHAAGWAHAMCTPYQWSVQAAAHFGGTRNGAIVHWPNGIGESGGLRHQWHHVIDVAPTVLELAGIAEPATIDGVPQMPMHGTSFAYSFNQPEAAGRHHTQYFELMGDRAIYDKGWTAVAKRRAPWDLLAMGGDFSEGSWELYDTAADWTQSHDLGPERPEKLAELQMRFITEATRFNVFPPDECAAELLSPDPAGRPTPVRGTSTRP